MNDTDMKSTAADLVARVQHCGDHFLQTEPIVSPGWDILRALYRTARPKPIAYLARETGNTQHILNRWTAALTSAGLVIAVGSPAGMEYALASDTRAGIEGIEVPDLARY